MDLTALIPAGLKSAIVAKVARWGGAVVGGIVFGVIASHTQLLSFLSQACASLNDEDAMKAAFGAGAAILLPLIYSIWDAKNVNGKMAVTASSAYDAGRQQGQMDGVEIQVVADTTKVAAVARAMQTANEATKQDKAAVIGALKTGSF